MDRGRTISMAVVAIIALTSSVVISSCATATVAGGVGVLELIRELMWFLIGSATG